VPTTQHRPHGAYAGPLFGTLDGKTEDPTPPVEPPKTQHRPHGAFAGPLFGTLAGKAPESGAPFDIGAPLVAGFEGVFGATGSISAQVLANINATAAAAFEGAFTAVGDFEFAQPGAASVTVRLVDAPSGSAPLPSLTGIQWAWWDNASDESETWGVSPTASGTTESTDGSGSITVTATASTKTSGQTVLIKLYQHGYPPRAFTGLLTVN
jgi:hypothetical protein